jgi:hypothetical protein
MTTDTLDTAGTTTESGTQDATTAATDTTVLTTGQGAPATASADNPPAADAAADTTSAGDSDNIEYEPFQLPEGMTVNEELLNEFKATAKDLKLPQEAAQKLADLQVKVYEKQAEAMSRVRAQWLDQTKTDKEFGGEALAENLGIAQKAMQAFATPQLRQLLNDSGLGNHPEIVRAFVRVGKAISEDGRVVTGSKSGIPADPAKRLFPNQS